ncbi:hypothetical protein [Mucilaginibacter jinjuensis]|uniref:Lipoprotein n=1 Tax=Mucilaginibacter jinjuensis TaxID=1176721 RepID=A0ABY7TBU0_9SPHI|nr:hypothetical protein [Mucilaginibacter jinjuensis]WCT13788.1 hypothetical protein PQO05_07550 [Mucilaginibacter jinjuensis]
MNKISSVTLLMIATLLISCGPTKQDRINAYKERCVLQANKRIDEDFARVGFLSPLDSFKVLFECNCQCKAEKLVEHFSESEMKRIDRLPENQVRMIFDPVVNSCAIDFEKNIRQFLNREKEREEIYMDALNQKARSKSKPQASVQHK